jgi:hypothetical protein
MEHSSYEEADSLAASQGIPHILSCSQQPAIFYYAEPD